MDEVQNQMLSEQLRLLEEEHRQYARQLEALLQKAYPSEEDLMEEVRLKKLKLRLKDQIAALQRGRSVMVA
jgi:hypothetical protein